ncbi:MFS transporter [Bradyrhizobium sp. NBAIM08]|uniref:MFS transporter n=1 Tax=Bradyrhizobium sp. NBAIM08 TaxID=2793815 RepID=UPI001CD48D5F|nr:MFS transporter [Bradyrhizobium sp. NBAIM08]MCA1476784.1 MFS transporter [Bradyrhizobium sp. NBAIM08]
MKISGARMALLLYLYISFMLVGGGIVLSAWIAFHYGGTGLVGWILIFTSGSTLVLAPVAGHIVDKHDRCGAAAVGQALRAAGFLALALPELDIHGISACVTLTASGAMGTFGFSLQMGAINALARINVAAPDSAKLSFQMSLAKQIGIASGTGLAGLSIDKCGPSATALFLSVLALCAASCLGLIRFPGAGAPVVKSKLGLFGASRQALEYLRGDPEALTGTISVGLAFAIIQTTNLLLPGFVVNRLEGSTSLFGALEMIAATAGFVAVVISASTSSAERLRQGVVPLLVAAGLSLVLFSIAKQKVTAIALYALVGVLWSLSRAAADAALLTFVEIGFIGRVQALTTLVTAAVGAVVYSLPTIFVKLTEAQLYALCGSVIAVSAACLLLFGRSAGESCCLARRAGKRKDERGLDAENQIRTSAGNQTRLDS